MIQTMTSTAILVPADELSSFLLCSEQWFLSSTSALRHTYTPTHLYTYTHLHTPTRRASTNIIMINYYLCPYNYRQPMPSTGVTPSFLLLIYGHLLQK